MTRNPRAAQPVKQTEYVPRWPGEFVRVGARELFVRHAPPVGAGREPAVFIHGLGGSASNWTELMGQLRDAVDGYAVDLPGFGHSPMPEHGTGDFSPRGHADAVADFIRHQFGERPVHVFGNSLGGATAVQLAAHHGDLVRTVTLISPALPDRVPKASNVHMPLLAVPYLGEWMAERVRVKPTAWRVNATLEICFADPRRVSEGRRADMIEEAREREALDHMNPVMLESLRGLMGTFFDNSDEQPWKLAERIAVPVLLVYGRDDKLVNPKAAFKATKAFPNARVAVIPDSGHVSQMEHPDVVANLWRELAR